MTIDELADKYSKSNSDRTVSQIVRKAKPYVKKIIHKLDIPSGVAYSQQDLEQEASFMVVKALRNYDRNTQAKFSTYMYLRVQGGLISYLRKHDTLTRTQRDRAGQVRKATHDLSQKLGREPSCKEISNEIDYTAKEVSRFIRQMNSRSNKSPEDDKEGRWLDQVEGSLNPEDGLSHELKERLKVLDVRSRVILLLVFFHGLTTRQVGIITGIHKDYVSTLKQRALKKLRKQ